MTTTTPEPPVHVFISYSDDSRKHVARVQVVAAELEEAGFSVFFDQWAEAAPGQWSGLVERELRRADVTLCVCTPTYCERVDGAPPVRQGPGTTQEAALIRKRGKDAATRAVRFMITHLGGSELAIPSALVGEDIRCFDWPQDRDALLAALAAPTPRRRLVDVCAHALGSNGRDWAGWAKEWVGLELAPPLEDRAQVIADAILRLEAPAAQGRVLAALADHAGADGRESVMGIMEALGLDALPRLASVASSRPRSQVAAVTHGPPVVLLALSNDHAKDGQYLGSLARESRYIEAALDGTAEVVTRPNARIEDVWMLFGRPALRGRIAVFHFAGHAGRDALVFEDDAGAPSTAASEGLADFLGRQEGLVLVFLNGCSTLAQVRRLRERGARAVIATREPILDAVAPELAARFYENLRSKPLEPAFLDAVAFMKTKYHGDPSHVLRHVDVVGAHGARQWPWLLECDDACKAWRLGEPPPPVPEGPVSRMELSHYLAKVRSRHQEVRIIGFETTVQATLRLSDLYVPLDATIDQGRHEREGLGQPDEGGRVREQVPPREDIVLADAFLRADRLGKRGVIVLGGPGAGKTTHLKQVLLELVQEGPGAVGLPEGTIPVFLPLRELSRDRSGGLTRFIEQQLEDPMLDMPEGFGRRLCMRGRLLFLLDGLDEVPGAEERAEVARWIEGALRDGPDCYFLVSCRYAGYTHDVALDAGFLELHLQPFDDDRMRQFVTNWYALVERAALGDPQQAAVEAERRTRDLLDTLSQTDFTAVARVYEMTRNPLLLTAICLVHRERGRLPHARARLYEESITVLLERWRRRPLPVDQAARVFQPVAHWMHSRVGRTKASLGELREPVAQGLAPLHRVDVDVDRFVESIRNDSGLLVPWGLDEHGFMHLGFQEYLTARWLRNVAHRRPQELAALARHFEESWWREVILLMVALDDPSVFDDFMRVVVQQPDFTRWAGSEMMELVLRETAEMSATPFLELLTEASEGTEERVERQLAALRLLVRTMPREVDRLGQMLRDHPVAAIQRWWSDHERRKRSGVDVIVAPRGGVELVRIPGGRFVMGEGRDAHEVELAELFLGRTPVTNAQYGEYLKANPKANKPSRWGDRKHNQPDQPVVGVSWPDATGYCEWARLTLPTEAQWEYACRAGTTTRYSAGDRERDLGRVGWYEANSGGRAHAVAEKEPNAFGLYDMHGNVLEWCMDESGPYSTPPRAGDGLRHPPGNGDLRVLRGGSWDNGAAFARSAMREWDTAGGRWVNVGFRVAGRREL